LAGIVHRLQSRHTLLVIDNCEHVVANAALVVADLLRRCPILTVLATSREALAHSGEVAYRLPSLDLSAACELFVARAKSADPTLSLDRQRLAVVEDICKALDGIPLAIELAASRISTLGFDGLRSRIGRGTVLTGSRDLPLRHQTMTATIAWSHDLLSDVERVVFRRLGVFAASFTIEAAEEVCLDASLTAGNVADHLSHLVQKCLVNVEHIGTSTRYRFLDAIRAFARERLSDSSELEATMARLIARLQRQAASIDSAPSIGLLLEHRQDLDNVGPAVRWATSTAYYPTMVAAAQIMVGFRIVWHAHGRGREAQALALLLLDHLDEGRDPEVVGRLLHALAPSIAADELLALTPRAIPLLERTGHTVRAAFLHARCAEAQSQRGNTAAAEHHIASATSLMSGTTVGSSHENVAITTSRAHVFMLLGDYASARAALGRLEIAAGDPFEVEAAMMLAEIEFESGNVERALELTKRWSLRLSHYPTATYLPIIVLGDLAKYLLATGEVGAADRALRKALTCALDTEAYRSEYVRLTLARYAAAVAALSGHARLGARLLGSCDAEDRIGGSVGPKETLALELTSSAMGAQLSIELIDALRSQGEREYLQDLLEEFLVSPAAEANARPSATSRPRATSAT
jgi:predicted ATPase